MGLYRNNNGVIENLTPTAPPAIGIQYDNSTTGLPSNVQEAIDKTTGNISSLDTVELTATATHDHAVGSTFLWIGQLVKATTAIAVGDTIAVGTNVKNTDICSVLDEVNNKIVEVQITTPATVGAFSTVPLPSGFYGTNSCVIGIRSQNGVETYPPIIPSTDGTVTSCKIYIGQNVVAAYLQEASFGSQTVTAIVQRYK